MKLTDEQELNNIEYLHVVMYCDERLVHTKCAASIIPHLAAVPCFKSVRARAYDYIDEDDFKVVKLGRCKLSDPTTVSRIQSLPTSVRYVNLLATKKNSLSEVHDFHGVLSCEDSEVHYSTSPSDTLGNSLGRTVLDNVVLLSIRVSSLLEVPQSQRLELVESVISEVVSTGSCYYGFVNCELVSDSGAGALYAPPFDSPYAMKSVIQELVWWHPETPRTRTARGVYWGNFWGPKLTQLMDEAGILEQLDSWRCTLLSDRAPRDLGAKLHRYSDGSSFFRMSTDPLNSAASWRQFPFKVFGYFDDLSSSQTMLAAWLHRKLRAANLLL